MKAMLSFNPQSEICIPHSRLTYGAGFRLACVTASALASVFAGAVGEAGVAAGALVVAPEPVEKPCSP